MINTVIAGLVIGASLMGPASASPAQVSEPVNDTPSVVYVADGTVTGVEEECCVIITISNGEEIVTDSATLRDGDRVSVKLEANETESSEDDEVIEIFLHR